MDASRGHVVLLEAMQEWGHPEQSCGYRVRSAGPGTHFWEIVGPAAKSWKTLSQKLIAAMETLSQRDGMLSLVAAMVGPTKETSAPKILLCSADLQISQAFCHVIMSQGIMAEHSGISIDFVPSPPTLLAMASNFDASTGIKPLQTEVWAANVPQQFGRRLIIPSPDGGPARTMTGGATIFLGSKAYQITALHDHTNARETHHSDQLLELDLETEVSFTDDSPIMNSGLETTTTSERYTVETKGMEPEIPHGSRRVGKVIPSRSGGPDYGLVELDEVGGHECNRVSYGIGKGVWVRKCGKIEEAQSSPVVIVVTSSGPVRGILTTTPSLLYSASQKRCQTAYALKVDGNHQLCAGDSGSGVVNLRTGEVLGHLVAAHIGTNIAYVLPMDEILEDIHASFHQDGSFEPLSDVTRIRHPLLQKIKCLSPRSLNHIIRQNTVTAPTYTVEFSSPRFYREEVGRTMATPHRFERFCRRIQFPSHWPRLRQTSRNRVQQSTSKALGKSLLSLPSETMDQIFRHVSPQTLWILRQVSRECRSAVLRNMAAMSELFAHKLLLPSFVEKDHVTIPPSASMINEVVQCHGVISKLAKYMSVWLGREIYGFRTSHQKREFESTTRRVVQHRLVPSLFAVHKFLLRYPESLRRQGTRANLSLPTRELLYAAESAIMQFYTDDMLQQAHRGFKILVPYLRFLLRLPSYYSPLEMVLHGNLVRKHHRWLDERVHSAILCLGGLESVVRLAEIDNYNTRRVHADKLFAALSQADRGGLCPELDLSALEARENKNSAHLVSMLPPLDEIWQLTGETILLERNVFASKTRITSYAEALTDLMRVERTVADRFYEEHALWDSLSDPHFSRL